MALDDIRHEVILSLAQTHDQQREARAALADGTDDEKVEAAGELDYLGRKHAMLERRLEEIDRRMAERPGVITWFRQEWFNLMLHLESWIAHG